MKITRRTEWLYIKDGRRAIKHNFSTIKKVFITPLKEIDFRDTIIKSVDLVLVSPCVFTTNDKEHRYKVCTGKWGNPEEEATEYKETIERFILEWQAKQNVL